VIILRYYSGDYNLDPYIYVNNGATYYVNKDNKKIYTSYDGTTYSNEINSITVTSRGGYDYYGAYDTNAESGGTQYINADGTFTDAARNIKNNITIYNRYLIALATNLKFDVRYSATSEYASVYMTWEAYYPKSTYGINSWIVTLYKDGTQIVSQEIDASVYELYNETLSRTAGTYYFTVRGISDQTVGQTISTSKSADRVAYMLIFDGNGGKLMDYNTGVDIVYGALAVGDELPTFIGFEDDSSGSSYFDKWVHQVSVEEIPFYENGNKKFLDVGIESVKYDEIGRRFIATWKILT